MKFILIAVAAMAAAYFMGISRNTTIRWLGQGILLALTLGIAGGALIKPETESGVLILIVVPLILICYIPWTLFRLTRDIAMTRDFTPEQKEQFIKEKIDDLEADLQKQLAEDMDTVNKFWISPAKRRRLRQNINHNKLMLAGFKKIESEIQKRKENHPDGPSFL